eukprot:TRINITY_DN56917_c0_g1_i1.p1 TRINITY_DN56917_c0_g1~~TRINITY_DN56917_c0_g1_i1.p1  ORF type:complete len:405 (+),score=58.23 TRINITY_DN56917_c0_g1_i1:79-1215(+)
MIAGSGSEPSEQFLALQIACQRLLRLRILLASRLSLLQAYLHTVGDAGLIRLQRSSLVQASMAAALSEKVETHLEAIRIIQERSERWRVEIASRVRRLDFAGGLLLAIAIFRGSRDACAAISAAVGARFVADVIGLNSVCTMLISAAVPPLLLRSLKRFIGDRLPRLMLSAVLTVAAWSNPGVQSFKPVADADAKRLHALTNADSSCGTAQETPYKTQFQAESFGLLTLAAVPNPYFDEAPDPNSREPERLFLVPDRPQKLYYLGAFDRWMCLNVSCARAELVALRIMARAAGMAQRGLAMWQRARHEAGLPPPGYEPILAKDSEQQCAICLGNRKDTILRPCGHLCCCWSCSDSIKGKCPVCREAVTVRDFVGQIYT